MTRDYYTLKKLAKNISSALSQSLHYSYCRDKAAIKGDWKNIGQDLRHTLDKYNKEVHDKQK